jgi:hypothetical protein
MWNVLVRWGAAGLQEKAAKILTGTKTAANPCHIWHRCSISGASIGRSLVRNDLAMKENLDLEDKAGSEYCEYELCMERTKPSRRLRNGGLFLERFVSSGRLEGWELSTLLLPQFLRWIYSTCTVPSSAQSPPRETPQHMSLPAKTSFNSHHQFSSFLSHPNRTIAIQSTSPMHHPPSQIRA